VDFALDHAAKNGWGAWYGAKKAGISNFEGIGAGGAGSAAEAVDKLASSAGAATKGLDTMAGGLGKAGQALSTSFFPAAPSAPTGGSSGGGLFGWLGGLFGGGPDLSKYKGLTGMFADGTNYAPGGMAIVGERGPELVNLPQGSQVFSNHRSAQIMRGGGGEAGGIAGVRVFVDQDGNWQAKVDSIANDRSAQNDQASFASFNEQQRRGGVGLMNRRYASQKN
jgi:hypothetical protein